MRWQTVARMVRDQIQNNDLLGLRPGSMVAGLQPNVAERAQTFNTYFRTLAEDTVRVDARRGLQNARSLGIAMAHQYIGDTTPVSDDKTALLTAKFADETTGVVAAVVQQVQRAVTVALLDGEKRSSVILNKIRDRITKVGVVRSALVVEDVVMLAFTAGMLDVYEAAGVEQVGVIPETRDAMTYDARKRSTPKKKTKKTAPRKSNAPKQLSFVRVQTAGDDRVCPICEDLEEGGPYSIAYARTLVPAHLRCRCVFVPARRPRS